MFQYHDRSRFEVYCIANTPNSPKGDRESMGIDWRKTIEEQVEHFVDVSGKSEEEIVKLVHDDLKIHILVDMDGYSNNGIRLRSLFPLQVAPIQVAMLVYVGTTGAPYMQYIVSDKVTTPKDLADSTFAEKMLWMPHSFFVNSHAHIPALPPPVEKAPRSSAFRFCNFNKHLKITPESFKLFASILKKTSNSTVLKFLENPKESEPRLRARLGKLIRGFDQRRFVYLPFLGNPYDHHRRLASECDLVLDNSIYNAHTMAVDTLWGGVPLVTFGNGVDMGGRVGYSILKTLGREGDLVAQSNDEYVAIAVKLASDPAAYDEVRARLVQTTRAGSLNPFWDTERYVKNLERGFERAWEAFIGGKEPANIDLAVEPAPRTAAEFVFDTCKRF